MSKIDLISQKYGFLGSHDVIFKNLFYIHQAFKEYSQFYLDKNILPENQRDFLYTRGFLSYCPRCDLFSFGFRFFEMKAEIEETYIIM